MHYPIDSRLKLKPTILNFDLWKTIAIGMIALILFIIAVLSTVYWLIIADLVFLFLSYKYLNIIKFRPYVLEEMIVFRLCRKRIKSKHIFNKKFFGDNE